MTRPTPITLEYARSFFDLAKREFTFLTEQDFRLVEERPTQSVSFRDGFHLRYASHSVDLVVDYYDMELLPTFHRGAQQASYYFIDRYLFSNASGFGGAMFPLDKLAAALRVVVTDIREHYGAVLSGDDTTWHKIGSLLSAPREKRVLP
jgi:hypothetical protein